MLERSAVSPADDGTSHRPLNPYRVSPKAEFITGVHAPGAADLDGRRHVGEVPIFRSNLFHLAVLCSSLPVARATGTL